MKHFHEKDVDDGVGRTSQNDCNDDILHCNRRYRKLKKSRRYFRKVIGRHHCVCTVKADDKLLSVSIMCMILQNFSTIC